MNDDDDQDDDAVDGIISETVARAVEPLAERLDALDRRAIPFLSTVRCGVDCTCGFKVSARGSEAMSEAYRDHTQFAHGQYVPVIQ